MSTPNYLDCYYEFTGDDTAVTRLSTDTMYAWSELVDYEIQRAKERKNARASTDELRLPRNI